MKVIVAIIRLIVAALAAGVALVLTVPFLVVAAPFWLVSALTHAVRGLLQRLSPGEVEWTDLIEFTPEIGWKNRGGVQARVRQERAFKVTTDADGWRGDTSIHDSDLIVVGDSFAFGHGVDDRDFFPEKAAKIRIKALGVNGYNMVQELLWMERLKDRIAGKLVVWLVFYGNDLLDNLHTNFRHYRTPFVRFQPSSETWEVVTSHVRDEPWPFRARAQGWGYEDKVAEVCCRSHQADRAFSACEFLLLRARDLCREAGGRLAVVGIPDVQTLDAAELPRLRTRASHSDSFDPSLPDRRLSEICDRAEVPFVALSRILDVHHHLPNDCHWTPQGHAIVAQVLEDLYGAEMRGKTLDTEAERSGLAARRASSPASGNPISETIHD